ncbi:hypothetical protein FOMG_19517 [Fusarium oxysporum f. sp. melonis 26406]|uniref:Uncharacterized protein n=2 Tax=Fusarium oxysporum TaxID=5507 RepID=A0A2H3FUQ4_FUSOX|nr:hypothetical protein FOMG_19517 [Fusarium oxysporum f. sp. melonis 26406]PCD22186.1 hypothetical protein AU210_015980 [Fusarium oxysporum f. sp. radicis-cucumerinum]
MKFLTLLASVSIALALATKPVQLGTEQDTIDPSLEPIPHNGIENTDPGSLKVVGSDVQAPNGGLQKRLDGIPVPYNVPGPQEMLLGGMVVSFTMVGKWVKEGRHNVYRYICKSIGFENHSATRKVVTVIANGVKIMDNQPFSVHRINGVKAPAEGFGNTVDIVIRNA